MVLLQGKSVYLVKTSFSCLAIHFLIREHNLWSDFFFTLFMSDVLLAADPTKNFKAIIAWWQDMAQQNGKCNLKPDAFSAQGSLTGRTGSAVQRENAAIIIQSHYRRLVELRNYMRIRNATLVLQSLTLAWLSAKKKLSRKELMSRTTGKPLEKFGMYVTFMADRHSFVNLRNSTAVIQQAIRAWIFRRYKAKTIVDRRHSPEPINVAFIQSCTHEAKEIHVYTQAQRDTPIQRGSVAYEENRVDDLQTTAATVIQNSWKNISPKSIQSQNIAATKIQSYYRGWLMRKSFTCKKRAIRTIQRSFRCFKSRRDFQILKRENVSAIIIQSHLRGWMARGEAHRYGLQTRAAILIQNSWRNYISRKSIRNQHIAATQIQSHYRGWLMRKSFACKKRAIRLIQGSFRSSRSRRDFQILKMKNVSAIIIQSHLRGWMAREEAHRYDLQKRAAISIQNSWKNYISRKSIRNQLIAATQIQSHYRGWLMRKNFACKKRAIRIIQGSFQSSRSRRDFEILKKKNVSAVIIQSHIRGWMARREAHREKNHFIRIQSFCRGWMQRKEFLLQKDAATMIQSALRCMNCRRAFVLQRGAAVDIQRFVRGHITRRRFLGAFCSQKSLKYGYQGLELKIFLQSVVKLQRWWRQVLQFKLERKSAVLIQSHFREWIAKKRARREILCVVVIQSCWKGYLARKDARRQLLDLQLRTISAVVIQSYFRGWIARQIAKREKQRVVLIQSRWRGYLARKDAKGQLQDLRLRMQQSAANVDDSRRLINRLISALSELLSMKSISNILHTCATLDVATELSQKCCEELVGAGAVCTLLKLIRSVSRSIPDQQVLKHALSTLRNLARYPNLTEVLVQSHGCVETIVLEFIRNKEEGYFIAAELLKRICRSKNGAGTIRRSPALLKRLNNLAEELSRKAGNDRRNSRNLTAREIVERRRCKEVVEILKLVANA